jgi:hypothetical protein
MLDEVDLSSRRTDSAASGLSTGRSAASVLLGAPMTLNVGAAKAPSMNCGRSFPIDILTTDLGSIRPVAARAEFALPGARSGVYRAPSFHVISPAGAGSAFAPSASMSMISHDAAPHRVADAWHTQGTMMP